MPQNRKVRKLCLELSDYTKSETLDTLSHLHLQNTGFKSNVSSIVLPGNLKYCFLDKSRLFSCKLPMSLQHFETIDSFVTIGNLDNHPNLTVLRMTGYYYSNLILPPNLIEFVAHDSSQGHGVYPDSITSLSFVTSHMENVPRLPHLTTLNMGEYNNHHENVTPFSNVQHTSFQVKATSDNIVLIPILCPNVTHVRIECLGSYWKSQILPVFDSVQSLHLEIPTTVECILTGMTKMESWKSLTDLTLVLSEWDYNEPVTPIVIRIPPNVIKLKIKSLMCVELRVHFPALLTHATLESVYPVFNVLLSKDAQLRTLRTVGNVFANTTLQLPQSLQSFHVRVGRQHLQQSWRPLPSYVDFQVFDN